MRTVLLFLMRIVWQRDGKHMMSSTALLAELISDGHATVGTRNFALKTTKNSKIWWQLLDVAECIQLAENLSPCFVKPFFIILKSFNSRVDTITRPCLSGVPFWENLQVKRHAFSARFSHPLSSSHFRQYFSSSSTSHYTIDVLFFFQFSSTLFPMLYYHK